MPSERSLLHRLTAATLKAMLERPFDRVEWERRSSEYLHLRIGNDPPATSRDVALDKLQYFLGRIEGFGCTYCELWQRREAIYAETDVCFLDADGRYQEIPCALVARIKDEQLLDLRMHLDPSLIP